MSRYTKVIAGTVELPEVNGVKFLIYPTIETRMELLEHIKATQIVEEVDEKDEKGKVIGTRRIKGKYLALSEIARTLSKIIFEGCFEHDVNGVRAGKKGEEADTTERQILDIVLRTDIMKLYVLVLQELDIINKDKASELLEGQTEVAKKE